ncbi:putative uncharacterized protein [Candidatus Colimorpha enterica]|uniref:Uncharacterized protein n=1 Tax=Candidatus Colimorpha enterica TaxID=3083063 RepID=R6TZT2_9BACT|nr:putative uncharacterized protein [Candidatus Colimorpha enterica]
MNLIDDENYVSERLHLIDKPLHSCLELSPELRSGNDRGHINKINLLAPEPERHVSCGDLNCKRLGNGGLSDTGFADKAGIVLLTAAKDLHDPGKLTVSADNPVDPTVFCLCGKVSAVLSEEFSPVVWLTLHSGLFLGLHTSGKRQHPAEELHEVYRRSLSVVGASLVRNGVGKLGSILDFRLHLFKVFLGYTVLLHHRIDL